MLISVIDANNSFRLLNKTPYTCKNMSDTDSLKAELASLQHKLKEERKKLNDAHCKFFFAFNLSN